MSAGAGIRGQPFRAVFREMLELCYLWRQPLRIDNTKHVAFLGVEPHTPIDEAVRTTLVDLGCLKGDDVEPTANLPTTA